ncbi:MAG: hypothetical protein ACJ75J_02050 [Cytophagaceae bacterium]
MIQQKNKRRPYDPSSPSSILLLIFTGLISLFSFIQCQAQSLDSLSSGKSFCHNMLSNGDFESGNTGFSSDYLFAPDYIDHGRYTITKDIHALDSASVSPAGGDHTTGKGSYMLVDAKIYRYADRSKVWVSEVQKITKNSEYTFSVWLARTGIGSPPELLVTIDDKPVAPSYRLGFAPGQWQKLSYTWKSRKNRKRISIAITSIYYYQYMEDFMMDDISFCKEAVKQ